MSQGLLICDLVGDTLLDIFYFLQQTHPKHTQSTEPFAPAMTCSDGAGELYSKLNANKK